MTISAPFRSIQRVYFDDLDALNILHNVRYILFVERARGELINALGFHWKDDLSIDPDKYHVVAERSIKYLAPFVAKESSASRSAPTHLGNSSLVIAAKVRALHGDRTYAEITTRLVRLDPAASKPCSWSNRFRKAVTDMMGPIGEAHSCYGCFSRHWPRARQSAWRADKVYAAVRSVGDLAAPAESLEQWPTSRIVFT
ncbi:MAG: hotdog domain-containing protein [Polyangiaceae bacterium]